MHRKASAGRLERVGLDRWQISGRKQGLGLHRRTDCRAGADLRHSPKKHMNDTASGTEHLETLQRPRVVQTVGSQG